jgi:hypothetical protein
VNLGLFKDLKKSMETASQAGQAGPAGMEQQYANAQAINNAQPAEDGDPLLEPIQGLSFTRYVDVAYATQHMGGDQQSRTTYAETQGIAPGTWESAAQEWSNRMMANPTLNKRFNAEWQKRMRGA